MSTPNADGSSGGRCGKTLIIAATILLLGIIFMYFRDRQRARHLEFERLDKTMEVWEEWEPPARDRQPSQPGDRRGKVL